MVSLHDALEHTMIHEKCTHRSDSIALEARRFPGLGRRTYRFQPQNLVLEPPDAPGCLLMPRTLRKDKCRLRRCRPLPPASSPNWRTRPPGWWQARQVSRLAERHATRSLPPRVVHSVCTRGGVAVRRKKSYHEVGIPQLAVS